MTKPIFVIKRDLQKSAQTGYTFKDQLSDEILRDVCHKITGEYEYDCQYVDNSYSDEFMSSGYNRGRMATLRYNDEVSFITFSERKIEGRNSSIQSVPTAFNIFYMCNYEKKRLYYYFINESGNALTDYHKFIYRLMLTIGFIFLNAPVGGDNLDISRFAHLEDIIRARDENRTGNRSNNSTYISKNEDGEYEAYCKTYGASKYESSLICYAASEIQKGISRIKLYEIIEGNLKELPASSLGVLKKMDTVDVIKTDLQFEKNLLLEHYDNNYRSPKYLYNLYQKLGEKKCALCDCCIPEIIQGAHVWPIKSIKRIGHLSDSQKLDYATDGNNGLWLCENHHKLFDRDIITIDEEGNVLCKNSLPENYKNYIESTISHKTIPDYYINDHFIEYVNKRISNVSISEYERFIDQEG